MAIRHGEVFVRSIKRPLGMDLRQPLLPRWDLELQPEKATHLRCYHRSSAIIRSMLRFVPHAAQGPFPIPMLFLEACGEERWRAFLDDVSDAYEMVQRRRDELRAVALALATPLVGPAEAPADGQACFATFLDKTLDRPASEVRQLAAEGPSNWSTRVKEATYRTGHFAGTLLRDAGVLPVV